MAKKKVRPLDFDAALSQILTEYVDDVTIATNEAVKASAKSAKQEIQNEAPVRTGNYKKDWAIKQSDVGRFGKRATVYNRSHYQLTHLLEKGHALRNGGRTKPLVHIAPAQEHAYENIRKAVEQIAGEG